MLKTHEKVLYAFVVVLLLLAVIAPTMAFALEDPPPTPPGPTPGLDRYLNIKDNIAAMPDAAQCGTGAGSGAFGYFGKDMNLAGGANGYQTGLNNSAVCGNRP